MVFDGECRDGKSQSHYQNSMPTQLIIEHLGQFRQSYVKPDTAENPGHQKPKQIDSVIPISLQAYGQISMKNQSGFTGVTPHLHMSWRLSFCTRAGLDRHKRV